MKLKEWCEKEGRSMRWIAEKIGMSTNLLYQVNQGVRSLRDEYIDKIIKLTNGECTYEELKRKPKK